MMIETYVHETLREKNPPISFEFRTNEEMKEFLDMYYNQKMWSMNGRCIYGTRGRLDFVVIN